MYNKFLILADKEDLAGVNIASQLSQFAKNPISEVLSKKKRFFDILLVDGSILHEANLDAEKIEKYDLVIFASRHKSEKNEKTLSVHAPGNWKEAKYGGRENKVCKSSAIFQKQLFRKLNDNAKKHGLDIRYKITLEATHHGPLIKKPCVFIEIGSTETEWKDSRAGFVVAKTISEAIEEFKEDKYKEVAIGLGGGHYCPEFTKLQLDSNVAFSHIISKYALPITEEILQEAWKNTDEEPDFIVVDFDGLGNSEEKQKVIDIIKKTGLPWKKLEEIKR